MTRKQWILVVLMFVGMLLAFGTYVFFNAAPAPWRWPGVWAANPATGEFLQPSTGDGAFQTFVLKSWADDLVPFVPILAIPYLSYLAIVPIVVPILTLVAKSLKGFFTIGWALIGAQLFMDLGYFLFQTWVQRTQTPPNDFFGGLVHLVWGNDQPFNGFPSAHCAWTTIGILALFRLRKRFPKTSWILMAWLLLIYPATVMLQQHYLIDVYAGIAIGIAAYSLALVAVERPKLALPIKGE